MKMHRSLRKSSFVPRVEALEARLNPSWTVTFGPLITITADQPTQSHALTIFDDGKGNITGFADGGFFSRTGVTSITVTGGTKSDSVLYLLTGDLQGNENLLVRATPGNDAFEGLLFGKILGASSTKPAPSNLSITVNNGRGDDAATLLAFGEVQSGATFSYINDTGGAGTGMGGGGGGGAGTPSTEAALVGVFGKISGTAGFDFTTGANASKDNKVTVTFLQSSDISGTETVNMHGKTSKKGLITDTFTYSGVLTGTLTVNESVEAGTAVLKESAELQPKSTGVLRELETATTNPNVVTATILATVDPRPVRRRR